MEEYKEKLLEFVKIYNPEKYEEKLKFYEAEERRKKYENNPSNLNLSGDFYTMGGSSYCGIPPKGFLPKLSKEIPTYVYIDAENITAKKYNRIKSQVKDNAEIRTYYVEGHDNGWASVTDNHIKKVPLSGKPQKDKVDERIKKEIDDKASTRKRMVIWIVSSDTGFRDIPANYQTESKRVQMKGMGEKKTPLSYRKLFTEFVVI